MTHGQGDSSITTHREGVIKMVPAYWLIPVVVTYGESVYQVSYWLFCLYVALTQVMILVIGMWMGRKKVLSDLVG